MDLSTARNILLAHTKLLTTIGVITADNDNYKAQNRTPWVRFTFTPVETGIETTGTNPWQRLQGLATIQLFEPKGGGATSLYTKADAILAHFPPSSFLGADPEFVHIDKSYGSNVIESAEWTQLSVYVRWYAFKRAT